MKKVLISILGLVALAGCSSHYDYYKGSVRYVQQGDDCVYYTGERGRRFLGNVRSLDKGQKLVYRNTFCADLFDGDTNGQYRNSRQVLTPAAVEVTGHSCACKSGCAPVMKRRYVIVSGM
ncbi:MAG: hypothetical protein LBJ73_04385 [Rickettsiales bacterium]|jgi:hypothetical protein|nr:hypothetical protein [Rickettsiales bacterium]